MEFQYHGGNCISVSVKGARLVFDDNLESLGLKSVTKSDDISLFTSLPSTLPQARLVFTDPGEYEASEISIFGIGVRGHMDEAGVESATIYKVQYGDTRFAVVGHIHPDIKEEDLEELGAVDILFVPVGGNGYTLDPTGALSIIKKFEPKIIIPTHFDDPKITYPVPQQPVSEALKIINLEVKESGTKFKLKPSDFSEVQSIVLLDRI